MLGALDAVRDWSFAGDIMRGAWLMLQQDDPRRLRPGQRGGRARWPSSRGRLSRVWISTPSATCEWTPRSSARPSRPPAWVTPRKARRALGWEPRGLLRGADRADGAGRSALAAGHHRRLLSRRPRAIVAAPLPPGRPYTGGRMATVGIIGLGYVGLPLAVAFAQEGCEVIACRCRPPQDRGDRGGRLLHRGCPLRAAQGGVRAHPCHHPLRPAGRGRRGADLRAHAAHAQPRARPRPADRLDAGARARCCRAISWSCSSRPPIPGTTRERVAPLLEESGLAAGRDFHLAFSPERVDPGRTDFTLRNTPKVLGGLTEACAERAEALYGLVCDNARARLKPRGGRADEAAGEHLPLGQHRAGQRAGDAHRPHGDRHLGGRRGGRDQALRVHALRAGARAWAGTACRSTPST